MTTRESRGTTPAEGDDVRASIETLFRAHWDELCRVAGGIVGSGDDAEDIVMDVLTTVLARASGDRSILTAPYLFGAVRQRALEVHRGRARRDRLLTSWTELHAMHGRTSRDPERELERKDRARILHEALVLLPEGQREAFEARDVHGLAPREAAELLGKTTSSLRKQAARALERLRDILRSWGMESIDEVGRWDDETDSA